MKEKNQPGNYGYDGDSREIAATNAASESTYQTWDAKSELIDLIDGAGHTSIRGYDGAGNQIVLTNRNGNPWQFQFDNANRLTNTISPLGRSTSVVFNHQGLPILVTEPLSITTNGYDAKGRLTNRADSFGSTLYRYDADDNLINVSENGLTNAWTYDAYDRVSSYADVYGNLIQYRYDANGNVTNLIYPGGRNVYYTYDSNNHLTSVTDWSERVTTMTYDLNGRLTSITRPNGTSRTISYDSDGEVTNILEQMANGLPIALMRYNWDQAARISLEFTAPLPHTNAPPSRSMTYNADNELVTVDGNTVTMDANGNLLSGPLTNDTFATYMYDVRNRLTNAAGVVNVYDAMNNRIGQTYGTNSIEYVVNPNTKLSQVLERVKNGVATYYIYGPGLLYQITEAVTGTNTLTYHYDYRGSTIALTSDSGLVTDRMEYSLYATMTYRAGTNDTPFLFAGCYGVQSDPNGLLYMRARYYSSYLCRFLNPDPSGFAAGMNFYAYVGGNPVSYTDPSGLNIGFPMVGYGALPTPQNTVPSDMVGQSLSAGSQAKVALFVASIPLAAFGGGIIDAAELGTLGTYGANAALGSSLSVADDTADQLIDNGGNLADINTGSQLIAGVGGLVFGAGSAGLGSLNNTFQNYFFTQMVQANAPGSYALSLGALEGMSSDEIGQAVSQADANTTLLNNISLGVNGAASILDNLGSPLGEQYSEDQITAGFGVSSQIQNSSTGK